MELGQEEPEAAGTVPLPDDLFQEIRDPFLNGQGAVLELVCALGGVAHAGEGWIVPLGGGSWLARRRFSRRSILWFRSGMRAMICSSRWSAAARAAALLSGSCCMGWNQPPASSRDTAVSAAVPSSEVLSHFPRSRRAMADVRRSPRAFSSAARSAAAPVAADAPAWAIPTWEMVPRIVFRVGRYS